jgi:hypothetical protein
VRLLTGDYPSVTEGGEEGVKGGEWRRWYLSMLKMSIQLHDAACDKAEVAKMGMSKSRQQQHPLYSSTTRGE